MGFISETFLLGLVAVAVASWGAVFPYPYPVVLAALLLCPVAGFLVYLKNTPKPSYNQPDVTLITLLPSVVLTMRGAFDFETIHMEMAWLLALPVSAAVTVCLTIALVRAEHPALNGKLLLIIWLLTLPYANGAILLFNGLLDNSPVAPLASKVLNKNHKSRGGRIPEKWEITLSGLNADGSDKVVSIPQHVFAAINEGDTVCVLSRQGALGLKWFTLQAAPCSKPTAGAAPLGRNGLPV